MFAPILLAVATISVGAIVASRRRRDWDQFIKGLESSLSGDGGDYANGSARVNQSRDTLPPVIQRYFRKVFSSAEYSGASDAPPFTTS
jgi:hypothetical protein